MPDVPIIGQNPEQEQGDDPNPVQVVDMAFLAVRSAQTGRWSAVSWDSPIDVFRACTAEDVIHGSRRIVDSLLAEEQAGVYVNTTMALAAQAQRQAADQALLANLNLPRTH